MRWLVLAGALLLNPSAVYAGHCGGFGGGGNGIHVGGGTVSGGSSKPVYVSDTAVAAASSSSSSDLGGSCSDEATDVVGYRRCTKFGAWATNMRLPRMFLELGSNVRQFTSGLGDQDGNVTHGAESFSYRVVMPTTDTARDVAVTSALRFGILLTQHVYTGVELELGGLAAPARAQTEMTSTGSFGAPNLEQNRGFVFGALGIAGVRGTMQRGALALEAAGGARDVTYKFASSYHDCETSTSIHATRAVVEARARAELWLAPWITAGATLGASVIGKGDWMAGVYLGVHSRAFAGGR